MFSLNENSAPVEAPRESFAQNEPKPIQFLPKGALVEISGPGARAKAASFLAQLGDLPAAWIEWRLDPFPPELQRTRMNYDRVLFIHGEEDSSWAASALLRSGEFPIVVYNAPISNERELRRYLRLARDSGTTFVVLNEKASSSTLFHLQIRAEGGGTEILRRRVS